MPNCAPTLNIKCTPDLTLYAQCEKGTTCIVLYHARVILVTAKSLTGAPFPVTSMDVSLKDYDEILFLRHSSWLGNNTVPSVCS